MKCISCDKLSFQIICKTCQAILLKPIEVIKERLEREFVKTLKELIPKQLFEVEKKLNFLFVVRILLNKQRIFKNSL